jgi:hypothetical protein
MKKKFVLLVAILLIIFTNYAQVPQNQTASDDVDYSTSLGLGFSAGTTTGIGFACRKHFNNRFGFHIGTIALGGNDDSDMYEDEWFWINVGGQIMYSMHRSANKGFRFFFLGGAQIIIDADKDSEYNWETEETSDPEWSVDNTYIIGAGLGIEFMLHENVGFSFELPLSAQFRNDGFGMYPIPNASLIYFF